MNTSTPNERGQWTSASSALADSLCKGRHLAQRGLPEVEDDYSSHGTDIHSALAKQDPAGLGLEQVETYDACREIENVVVSQVFGNDVKTIPLREQRFWIKFRDLVQTQHSAQIDCVHFAGARGLIVEYKTLTGEVPSSPQNLQLRDQVVLFDHNTPGIGEIVVVVIQPWVTRRPQLSLYKRDDIARAQNEMYARIISSNDPKSIRTPGDVQCKYCRAASAGKCPEYNKWAGALVTADSSLLDIPFSQWTPDQRRMFCDMMPAAEKWLENGKKAIKELLKADPESVPGYGLKDGANKETIINPQAVFDLFSQRGGSLNQFMECISIGKGDLQKAMAEITKFKGKKLDAELAAVIGENHTFKQNEPSLVKKK
jgi:Protein of unknown function (DUF2800)